MDLLLATRNRHKTREFAELLGKEFQIVDLSAEKSSPIEETGKTFAENAILKAVAASQLRQAIVAADDSGLEVDALGGAPGIYSARYAGEKATDAANVQKLLGELKSAAERSARFHCVIALAQNGNLLGTFAGAMEGQIVDLPRGDGGFGYDPIFQPAGYSQTFAEMPPELKNKISHRARAIEALRAALRESKF
ncbi:MAG TPA: RdgB/HAM1 family non-canonical purine NTP pyrophosphatase [Chthoniobacterales bacterium]|jgi:XTP/dITP diphosphohydrolase|nr:RdgB/HAM1 family non-canonical purine NTP pyrophosphatase [Chthoniobacterales bacterium]